MEGVRWEQLEDAKPKEEIKAHNSTKNWDKIGKEAEISNKEMIFYQLRTTTGILNIFKGEYKNNPQKITFSFSGLDNFLLELDKQNLTVNLRGDDLPVYRCEVFNGDLEIYFKNLQTKIKNELKSN